MYKTLQLMGFLTYQLVQDFFHQQYHSIASPLSHRQTVCLRESSILPKNQSLKNDISNHKKEPRIVILEIQDHLVVDFNPCEKYALLGNHESCSDLSGYAKPGS